MDISSFSDNERQSVANTLKMLRLYYNFGSKTESWTQKELAKKVGVPIAKIINLEQGNFTADTLQKVFKIFGFEGDGAIWDAKNTSQLLENEGNNLPVNLNRVFSNKQLAEHKVLLSLRKEGYTSRDDFVNQTGISASTVEQVESGEGVSRKALNNYLSLLGFTGKDARVNALAAAWDTLRKKKSAFSENELKEHLDFLLLREKKYPTRDDFARETGIPITYIEAVEQGNPVNLDILSIYLDALDYTGDFARKNALAAAQKIKTPSDQMSEDKIKRENRFIIIKFCGNSQTTVRTMTNCSFAEAEAILKKSRYDPSVFYKMLEALGFTGNDIEKREKALAKANKIAAGDAEQLDDGTALKRVNLERGSQKHLGK